MSSKFEETFIKNINFIHDVKIFNEIQNYKKILIFDFRKKEDFDLCHLDISVNIPFNKFEYSFFESIKETELANLTEDSELKNNILKYKRFYIAIIMSVNKISRNTILNQDSLIEEENEIINKCLLFYKSLTKARIRELGLYNKGFERFSKNYYFIINNLSCSPLVKKIDCFPTEIIDKRIFVGDQTHATSDDVIKFLGITHIINVTQHMKNKYENNGIEYLNIKIEDTDSYRIGIHFHETFDFIEKALVNNETINIDTVLDKLGMHSSFQDSFEKISSWHSRNKLIQMFFKYYLEGQNNKNKILIHCSMGVSRSPTICIMYLMKRLNLSFEYTYDFIKFQREKSDPIDSFQFELENYGKNGFQI